jgi:hypothetical protein
MSALLLLSIAGASGPARLNEQATADPVLSIVGPTTMDTGSSVLLEVTGCKIAGRWTVYPSMDSKHFEGLPVQTQEGITNKAYFWPVSKGTYYLRFDVPADGLDPKAECVITVGGENPPVPPDPIPPDPVPPTPTEKWQVAFFYDNDQLDNLTADQMILMEGLRFRKQLVEAGNKFVGSFEKDSLSKIGSELRSNLNPWFGAVEGSKFPVVAIAPLDGGTIQVFPLPEDEKELYALLATSKQKGAKP